MTFEEIKQLLLDTFGESVIIESQAEATQPFLTIKTEWIQKVCQVLHEHEKTYFDFLACITGLDNGPQKGTLEVIYHLRSIPYQLELVLKVIIPRNEEEQPLPQVPSLSSVWRTANWHEREIYDLLGIEFTEHPDLRRIFLPADWEGHPLRKDYQHQERYHGIRVAY